MVQEPPGWFGKLLISPLQLSFERGDSNDTNLGKCNNGSYVRPCLWNDSTVDNFLYCIGNKGLLKAIQSSILQSEDTSWYKSFIVVIDNRLISSPYPIKSRHTSVMEDCNICFIIMQEDELPKPNCVGMSAYSFQTLASEKRNLLAGEVHVK